MSYQLILVTYNQVSPRIIVTRTRKKCRILPIAENFPAWRTALIQLNTLLAHFAELSDYIALDYVAPAIILWLGNNYFRKNRNVQCILHQIYFNLAIQALASQYDALSVVLQLTTI